jgi:hypothetical protein
MQLLRYSRLVPQLPAELRQEHSMNGLLPLSLIPQLVQEVW